MGCCAQLQKKPSLKPNIEPKRHIDLDDIRFEEVKFQKKKLVKQRQGKAEEIYRYIKQIGRGTFGIVYLAENRQTQIRRAIKVIPKEQKGLGSPLSEIINEVTLLTHLDHPNIVPIYESFESDSYFYIVTEHCEGGELFDFIVNRRTLTEVIAAKITHQLLSAVAYCHSQNVVHRDLKPENLLLTVKDDYNSLKVADFGTSTIFSARSTLREMLGTAYYIAPEILKKSYDEKCDLWSCGVILYILLSGVPPFTGKNDAEVMENILKGTYSTSTENWPSISVGAKDFVQKLLTYDPIARPTALEALQNPWLTNSIAGNADALIVNSTLRNLTKMHTSLKIQQGLRIYIASQLTSEEDKLKQAQVFKSLDTNGDGRLSRSELITGYSSIMSEAEATLTVDKIMHKIDSNGNGFIEYTEFIAASLNFTNEQAVKLLENAFKAFDIDHSGKISAEELKQILGDESHSASLWPDFTKLGDVNGDGEIDINEFISLIMA